MSIPNQMIDFLCEEFKRNNSIDKSLYNKLHISRGLRNQDGTGVAVGITNICTVRGYLIDDGEKLPMDGQLRYRGYSVEDLVAGADKEDRFGFEEVIYLLLFGALPNKKSLADFSAVLAENRELPKFFVEDQMVKNPSKNIMNKMERCLLDLYAYDLNPDDVSVENVLRQSVEIISKLATIMTSAYQVKRRHFDGKSMYFHPLDRSLSTAESILMSLRSDKKFTHEEAIMLDRCLMLHADHGGGNNSTFTVRCLTTTGTDTYSALSGGIASLKGPLHGGANIQVNDMLADFKRAGVKSDAEVKDYIAKTIRKEAGDKKGLIYGMGHAVYSLSDPRKTVLKNMAEKNAHLYGLEDDFKLLDAIERLTPEVFAEVKGSDKPLCANVDMYSGLLYRMLGIDEELFTPLFAVSRVAGWSAHRLEELNSYPRIMRPAYRDNIHHEAKYINIEDRG